MQVRGTWSAGPDDDHARFLADLRALRDSAAIGYDELAARAHYPSNVLKEAENGPYLPGLPILAAYVRACEGDVPDWEERWRKLNPDVADDPDLPVRPAGASAAAVAGARAGVGVAPPDVYDPERIKAALRGDHARSERVGRRADGPGTPVPSHGTPSAPAAAASDQGWDPVTAPAIAAANGNHSAHQGRGPFEAASAEGTDSAGRTETAPAGEFSWLRKSAPETRTAEGAFARPEQPPATPLWRADEAATTPASRPAPAETAAASVAAASVAGDSGPGAATKLAASSGTAARATAAEADTSRADRLFPMRLLVVIVIAALIGSALVMLLK